MHRTTLESTINIHNICDLRLTMEPNNKQQYNTVLFPYCRRRMHMERKMRCSAQNAICRLQKRKFASNRTSYRALASFLFQWFHHLQCWLAFFLLFVRLVTFWFEVLSHVQCIQSSEWKWGNKKRTMRRRWWCRENMCTVINIHQQRQNVFSFLVCVQQQKNKKSIIRYIKIQKRLRR